MKRLVLLMGVLTMIFSFSVVPAFAGNARDSSLEAASKGKSVDAGSLLKVKSVNTIHGDVKADKNSTVEVGNTEITNTKASTIDIDTHNEAKGITAKSHSSVKMGNTKLSNVKSGGLVKVKSKNVVTGKVTAEKGSDIDIGSTNLSNIKSGKIDIYTENTILGKVKATKESIVKIGTTSTW